MAEHRVRVAIKRVYEKPDPTDGTRILVDRLWARGVSKDAAGLDAWMKELGPTDELRTWFGHQPNRWDAFVETYRHELATPLRQLLLAELQGVAGGAPVTLVYGARDTKQNEAVVLRDYLLQERAHADDTWDAPTKLLLTAAVVAAAHHGAVAPTPGLKRLASPILRVHELDSALKELVTRGALRESVGGWRLTPRAQRQVRQLVGRTEATD
jgi:uncharacterized protein YeaO (DUF488 family)